MWDPEKELAKMSFVEPSAGFDTRMAALCERYRPEGQEVAGVVTSRTSRSWWGLAVASIASCAAGIALGFTLHANRVDSEGISGAGEQFASNYHALSFAKDFDESTDARGTWFSDEPCTFASRVETVAPNEEMVDFETEAESELELTK